MGYLNTTGTNNEEAVLPCTLSWSCGLLEKYPVSFGCGIPVVIASAGAIVVYLDILSTAACVPVCLAAWVMALLLIALGACMRANRIVQDILEFNGCEKAHSNPHVVRASKEGLACMMLGMGFSAIAVGTHFFLVRPKLDKEAEMFRILATVNAGFISLTIGPAFTNALGTVSHFCLVARLLGDSLEKHFTDCRNTLMSGWDVEATPGTLDAKSVFETLDGLKTYARGLFHKVNRLITMKVVGIVIIVYLISLALILAFVVRIREEGPKNVALYLLVFLATYLILVGTGLLMSLTDVAERYKVCADDMGHDIKLRLRLSQLIPGAAGVSLLNAFRNEWVNELSFAVHNNAIDRRVLEMTLFRLALGAVVTVALGVMRG